MAKDSHVGVEFRQAMLHYMTALAARRDFAGVVAYYESNRRSLATTTDAMTGEILHHAARAFASLSQYPQALKTARAAQTSLAAEGDSIHLAELFVTLGGILRDMGEIREAEKAFRDAESIFRRYDSPEGQSRALNLLAGLFYRQNDYKNALSALMDAIKIARGLKDQRKIAFMMGNIGRIYTFTGDFSEAKKHLQINIDLSAELGDSQEEARARIALGYVLLQQGDYEAARTTLDEALSRAEALGMSRSVVICRTYLGELQYRTGRYDEALGTLQTARAEAAAIAPDSSLLGRVLRHLAELEMLEKNFRGAKRLVAKASMIMERAGDQVEFGALLKLKALIAASEGHVEQGRVLMNRAINVLYETGVRFEMAGARLAAGKSDLYDDRHRLTHLFHAEEFYGQYQLTHKLREVQEAIARIEYAPSGKKTEPVKPTEPSANRDYLTNNAELIRWKKQLAAVAQSDLPLLLTGETGVGKDRMARYYHSICRPNMPYVAVNCAAIPKNLLESELFGYARGAFTGADSRKLGLFVAANGGVLLLDEIGDMPLELQTKLLGVLESRKVVPLGTTREVELDFRLVAATNQDLEKMVEDGRFRRDLYYRLTGFSFEIPPLRKRKEDIPLLMQHFMVMHGLLEEGEKPSPQLVQHFIRHDWHGNVRELEHQIKKLEVMAEMVADGDLLELSRSIFAVEQPSQTGSLAEQVDQFERQLLVEALVAANGNKSEAARQLGIHEATVRTKLKRYAISLDGDGLLQ